MVDYASVDDLRVEGVPPEVSDALLQTRIRRASALIEKYTRNWFYPRQCVFHLDGSGSGILQIEHPIIAVTEVRVSYDNRLGLPTTTVLDPTLYRVFNRHLTEHLLDPDDRANPKVQCLFGTTYGHPTRRIWVSDWFPKGVQNIQVSGLFGYTDPDDGVTLWTDGVTPVGVTPETIRTACMMLVVRDLLPLADIEGRSEQGAAGAIRQLRTRDQQITYGSTTNVGATASGIAGNTELEAMLAPFCRRGTLGAV